MPTNPFTKGAKYRREVSLKQRVVAAADRAGVTDEVAEAARTWLRKHGEPEHPPRSRRGR